MGKHPPAKDQILAYFLLQLLIFYLTVFYTFFNLNIYSAILIFFIIMTVILHPIKKYMESSKFAKDPKAFNCNMT